MDRSIEEQLDEDRQIEAEHGVAPGRTDLPPREQHRRLAEEEARRRHARPPQAQPREADEGADGPLLPPLAIIVSRYNDTITDNMLAGAVEEFRTRGGRDEHLAVIDAFGAFELTPIAEAAARSGLYAGVLCLGCIIKGETDHDTYIAHSVAQGLANIAVQHSVPCAFGVLTVNTIDQAVARAGGRDGREPGNKGAEGMAALVETVLAKAAIQRAVESGNPAFRFRIPVAEPSEATPSDAPRKGPVRASTAAR